MGVIISDEPSHHSQYSSSFTDGRDQVLVEDLILRWVELLQFH